MKFKFKIDQEVRYGDHVGVIVERIDRKSGRSYRVRSNGSTVLIKEEMLQANCEGSVSNEV